MDEDVDVLHDPEALDKIGLCTYSWVHFYPGIEIVAKGEIEVDLQLLVRLDYCLLQRRMRINLRPYFIMLQLFGSSLWCFHFGGYTEGRQHLSSSFDFSDLGEGRLHRL